MGRRVGGGAANARSSGARRQGSAALARPRRRRPPPGLGAKSNAAGWQRPRTHKLNLSQDLPPARLTTPWLASGGLAAPVVVRAAPGASLAEAAGALRLRLPTARPGAWAGAGLAATLGEDAEARDGGGGREGGRRGGGRALRGSVQF